MHRLATLLSALLALPATAEEAPFHDVLGEVERSRLLPGLASASLGFALLPLDEGSSAAVVGHQPDLALLPASTLKVVTTVTALELLGSAFRLQTTLAISGELAADGTLHGDVVIRGGGDPTLGFPSAHDCFARWQRALREAGIHRIEGRVIGDDSLFGTQLRPDSWQWNDLGNYYAAGASALTFHRNEFLCHFRPNQPGAAADFLGTTPVLPGVSFVNEMRSGPPGSGDHGYVFGAPYSNRLYLRGTVPADEPEFAIRGALPDPALFCAGQFTRFLRNQDLPVMGEPVTARLLGLQGQALPRSRTLRTEQSPPLEELVAVINLYSDNLYAECLHRLLGAYFTGEGSTSAANHIVTSFWTEMGLDLAGFRMADGCGLSRSNTITARQLVQVLAHAADSDQFDPFLSSLPVAGRSGTLRTMGRASPSAGRVRAKSGSIERVKCYCGYIDSRSGRRFAFAILINHYDGPVQPIQDAIVRIWNAVVAL